MSSLKAAINETLVVDMRELLADVVGGFERPPGFD